MFMSLDITFSVANLLYLQILHPKRPWQCIISLWKTVELAFFGPVKSGKQCCNVCVLLDIALCLLARLWLIFTKCQW